MSRRTFNAQGVEIHLLSIEVPVHVHRSLRIIAAENSLNLSEMMRGVIDQFLKARSQAQQSVPPETSDGEEYVQEYVPSETWDEQETG